MRPIRRFGTPNLISDRLSSKSQDKINTLSLSRPSWSSGMNDDRARLQSLFYSNNYTSAATTVGLTSSDKENRLNGSANGEHGSKPEIIMNTPGFQLVCDRRRVQPRHASADDALTVECSPTEKPPKSAMKKSPTDGEMATHRSRWTSFRRSVTFADDKGLKLAEIKLIDMATPEDNRLDTTYSFNQKLASGFIADFILPPSYRRLRALQITDLSSPPVASSQIVLESYTSSRWSVQGIIAVRNNPEAIGQKRVFVRYTTDQWSTSTDNEASQNRAISEPNIDKYSFTLPFPMRPQTGTRLEFKFGVRMPAGVGGVLSPITYWDDNHGSNYSFTFV